LRAKAAIIFLTDCISLSISLLAVATIEVRRSPYIPTPVNFKAGGIFVLAATDLMELR